MLIVKTYTIMPAATAIAMSSSVDMIGEIAFLEVNRTFQSAGGGLYNPSEQLLQFGSPDFLALIRIPSRLGHRSDKIRYGIEDHSVGCKASLLGEVLTLGG